MRPPLLSIPRPGIVALAILGLSLAELRTPAQPTTPTAEPIVTFALPGPIGSILVQPDGKIVVMGCGFVYFQDTAAGTIGEISAAATRFTADGALDLGFAARANLELSSSVFEQHLSARADGRILVAAGFYGRKGGLVRPELKLLLSDGSLDQNFAPWCGATNDLNEVMPKPFSPLPLRLAAFDTNGIIATPCLVKNPQTSELRAFTMDDRGCVTGQRQPDWAKAKFPASIASSLTERGFHLFRPVDWNNHQQTKWSLTPAQTWSYYFFCMAGDPPSAGDAAQVLQALFAEFPLELCNNAARLPDGGTILLVQDGDSGRFMRFDQNWLPDLTYTNSLRARAYLSLALQPDGKLLIARGSELRDLSGTKPGDVVRVFPNGSIDQSFRCDTDERVMAMTLQADGKILIGGFFNTVNGIDYPRLARLNPDGSLDRSFPKISTAIGSVVTNRRLPVKNLTARSSTSPNRTTTQPGTTDTTTTSQSVLITAMSQANGVASLNYQGAPGQTYLLQARASLDSGEWFTVATNRTDANGVGNFTDSTANDAPARFYRVALP